MKKTTLMMAIMMVAMIGFGMKAKAQTTTDGGLKIAYVNYDSLQAKYTLFQECKTILEKKAADAQAAIQAKMTAFQKSYESFQQKVQKGLYKTQAAAEQAQKSLQNQQAQIEKLQQTSAQEFQAEQDKYNDMIREHLQSYIKEYNAKAGYTFILTKSGDNMLFADPSLDITDEVVKGLNEKYMQMTNK